MAYFHKKGDAFDLSGQVTVTENGAVVSDMTGWTATCQIRTLDDTLIANVTFTWINAALRLCHLLVADTSAWPVGVAQFDIRFVSPGGVPISSGVQQVQIVKGVTSA